MNSLACSATPVIIVGAGRSGTNMLRDVLTKLDGVETWPCDEINYIWRHGNRDHPNDQFVEKDATDGIKLDIRTSFDKMIRRALLKEHPEGQRIILEKTCANSLRVPFVDAVLPEAKYLFLVRDGRDVVASARKRWQAPLDIPYLLAKAKYVPKSDLAYYATRYIGNRFSKLGSEDNALSVWGPRFEGMEQIARDHDLDHVCAHQWVRCVESSEQAFARMRDDKYRKVYYEDFVNSPREALKQIVEFLNVDHSDAALDDACKGVRTSSVGKGASGGAALDEALTEIMRPVLEKHQYWNE